MAFSISPAIKSAFTASIGTPLPLKRMPVWPVPTNSTALPRFFKRSATSHAVVILPESQSVPTIKRTGVFLSFHDPIGK